jgi:F-type H+-transporting ATPase subunit b
MTLLPLALAAADSKITVLTDKFGVDLPHFLAQVVNFSVLAIVLWYFAVKPALGQLEARTALIEKGLADAEAAKQAKADAERRREEVLTLASQEAAALVAQASATAKKAVEDAKAAAAAEAAEVLRRGQSALETERAKMLAEVRAEVARLVVATTAKVIDQSLDDAAKARVNEAAAKALAN